MNEISLSSAREFLTGKKSPKSKKDLNFSDFYGIKIGLASPQKIKAWSYGEVKKPETINYRTLKPEKDGLLCQRIFGPVKDFECECGKYRWIKFKNVVCDRCGVEVTEAKVRRERMGHIDLAAPVAHIWFLRKSPSRIGLLLNMRPSDLEKVVYYAAYVVLEDTKDPVTGRVEYKKCDVLTEVQLEEVKKKFPKIKVGTGAGAIKEILEGLDLKKELDEVNKEMDVVKDGEERSKLIKRLQMLESFEKNGTRPEWMIMTVLPVIPPDLRPLVPLEGGRFASSDLNDLYRRIINRNNRLKHIESLRAPQVMIFNEKRLLQEAVDALIENGGRGKTVMGSANRPLKSLSDILKGKQGRFRQNLLGKRVDYSGRSVIVVGPELKLNQCGLPKEMALELFKPFVLSELIKKENITLKIARKKLEHADNEIWDILERVTKKHPVMLNRAPTLHRLGIQAFEPVLVEGLAIRLHPLTCAAFNADFDGDQMAVHVPISPQAQMEARTLMMATNNIISPASGRPIASPSHDMVLGVNYLTKVKYGEKGQGMYFADFDEAMSAYQRGVIDLHAPIKVKGFNAIPEKDKNGEVIKDVKDWKDYTTIGRIIFFKALPEGLDRKEYNRVINKKDLGALVYRVYSQEGMGQHAAVTLLDNLMNLGFHYATLSGLSISIADMKIPQLKEEIIKKADKQVKEIEEQAQEGIITDLERYNKIVDIWTHVSDKVADLMFNEMKKSEDKEYNGKESRFNSVFMMADSGARGSRQQVRQLAGMRGLMAKPQKKLTGGKGEIIENPIRANFREGLTVLEYFISTHGGRKGLSDTALKTADAGYLTRRLIDVAHNVVITEEDCGTLNGIKINSLKAGKEILEKIEERLTGRVLCEDIEYKNKKGEEIRIKAGEYLYASKIEKIISLIEGDIKESKINEKEKEERVRNIIDSFMKEIQVRSVLTCESKDGVCSKCFGLNLATNKPIEVGEAVGIIAAQSIGEPGTQLTLRTFHVGGTSDKDIEVGKLVVYENCTVNYGKDLKIMMNRCYSRSSADSILTLNFESGDPKVFQVPYGAYIYLKDGEKIKATRDEPKIIAEWNPYFNVVMSDNYSGVVEYIDIKLGVNLLKEKNKVNGIIEKKIIKNIKGTNEIPRIGLGETYYLTPGFEVLVDKGQYVNRGDIIAKTKSGYIKSRIPGKVLYLDFKEKKDNGTCKAILNKEGLEKYEEILKKENLKDSLPRIFISYKEFNLPLDSILVVDPGTNISYVTDLAIIPKQYSTKDITSGLPRVAELFELRKPKNSAIISRISGTVTIETNKKGLLEITVKDEESGQVETYPIPFGKHSIVYTGDRVAVGEQLTDGSVDIRDILEVKGIRVVQTLLVDSIQEVYRIQGVNINDKYIEIIVRQMLSNVRITNPGGTRFSKGEIVSKKQFLSENENAKEKGLEEAQAEPILLGISKASLASDSFVSAASFQETTRVLTDAATTNKSDDLKGLKENVIIGHLVPCGTGLSTKKIFTEDQKEEKAR
ncbi:MAG: DNA-directed RNA polymerase subunit beta' [Elusimicrobia bacterium]|nr:DNA-directed RNA polymerase subunit beta' [Elusimicrobiota bacterium]